MRRASGQRLNRVGSITEEPLTKTVDGVTYIIEKSTTIATQTEALPVDNLKELESYADMITHCSKQIYGKITTENGRKEVLSTLVSTNDPGDPVSNTTLLMAGVMLESIKGDCPLNDFGNSALHKAANNDNLQMFKLIAKNSENLSPRNNYYFIMLLEKVTMKCVNLSSKMSKI